MPQPPAIDVEAVIQWVRCRGLAHYPLNTLPDGYLQWRHQICHAAERDGLSVSVLWITGNVLVGNRHHQPGPEDYAALARLLTKRTTIDNSS